MPAHVTLTDLYGPMLERLNHAMLQDDSEAFHATLEAIKDERADDVTRELRVLAETLHDAMLKFRHEFRISDLAERDVDDAPASELVSYQLVLNLVRWWLHEVPVGTPVQFRLTDGEQIGGIEPFEVMVSEVHTR